MRFLKAVIPAILLMAVFGCRSDILFVPNDPFYESFFEKTSLLMTDEEIQIYKNLLDKESKEEFIKDFWALRGADSTTGENEVKEEFERRVEYANKWFGIFNPDRGRETERNLHSKTGWSSDRGRIYIVFGEPDAMSFGGGYGLGEIPDIRTDGFRTPMDETRFSYESWWYDQYQLAVTFSRQGSDWQLTHLDPFLPEAMRMAKLNMMVKDKSVNPKKAFRFSAEYKNGLIRIRIPTIRVTFDDKLSARFKVRINVYYNYRKLITIDETKVLDEGEGELLKKKSVFLEIPYKPGKKGKYLFDIIVQDTLAFAFSKYRTSVKTSL